VNKFRPWSDLPSAQELIDGLRMYIRIARENNLKVYIGTLLPIEGWRTYAEFREKLRCSVNEWIRTTDEIDGVIDFDRAVRCDENPAAFGSGYDSGDHLHPSAAAYKRMAEEVPEEILK
jgi:lysophospholipase L1-like esterase